MTDTETPRTAAERVIRSHIGSVWCPKCGPSVSSGPSHLADMLRDAGLLATPSAVEPAKLTLPEWQPDCGGDWTLSGDGFFANYWPDNSVSAVIYDDIGDEVTRTGIVFRSSKAECQVFVERWLQDNIDLLP